MPKIKVKNIPLNIINKICNEDSLCEKCPFNIKETCTRIRLDEFGNEVIELSEKDFPTNREWLESLSDEDLAAFYTHGVLIERYSPCPVNLHQIVGNFISSEQGIKNWLSQPCIYLVEREEENNEG